MKHRLAACLAAAVAMTAASAMAAGRHPAQKGPPTCSALTFRALPSGAADGDQQAGFYRSRYGTLAVHADVKGGKPTDYIVLADGKKLGAAPTPLPEWAANCAAAKQMPKPDSGTSPCDGQRFRVVLAHDTTQRLALLYGLDGSTWHFCSVGSY